MVLPGFVSITLWVGGTLELERETGKEWEWAFLISGVHWSWELRWG